MSQKTKTASNLPDPQGLTLAEKVLEHLQVTEQGLQKAAAAEASQRAKQAQVEALIPQVVNAMVQHGRIREDQREKLAQALRDPAQVLDLMIKVAGHRNAEELGRLGTGVDAQTKTAADRTGKSYDPARSLSDPNVGARTTHVKQSSVNLFRRLGLTPPTT